MLQALGWAWDKLLVRLSQVLLEYQHQVGDPESQISSQLCTLTTVIIHNLHTGSNTTTTSVLPLLHSEYQQDASKEPGCWESLSREERTPKTCNSGPPPQLWILIFLNQAQDQGQQELPFPPHPSSHTASSTKESFTEFSRHTWA